MNRLVGNSSYKGLQALDVAAGGKQTGLSPLQRGATLVELVITIVIISISVGAVIATMSRITAHSADPMIEAQAVAIAQSYLEEIMLKPFNDPTTGTACPAAVGGRSTYDNICDYNGLVDSGARDQSGAAPTGLDLSAYTVSVTVTNPATLGNLVNSAQVLRVDVKVTFDTLVDITLSGYRTNY